MNSKNLKIQCDSFIYPSKKIRMVQKKSLFVPGFVYIIKKFIKNQMFFYQDIIAFKV